MVHVRREKDLTLTKILVLDVDNSKRHNPKHHNPEH